MKAQERRRAARVFHALKATLEWENGECELVSTIDLSTSGVLLDAGRVGRKGEIVRVRFEISPGTFTEAAGTVQRSVSAFGGRRYTLALSFLEPQDTLFSVVCARELAWSGWLTA